MKRAKHTLSHYQLLTGDMGKLLPIGCIEVLPGDSFNHSVSALIRVAPLNTPVMHPVNIRLHHFFVPNRILWDSWENLITGGPDGTATPEIPTILNTGGSNSVLSYMGVPTNTTGNHSVISLPLWGYNAIYNEFFRDSDIITERGDENNDLADIAWEKDYFSTSRPWTQKGPEITIPITGQANVHGLGIETRVFNTPNQAAFESVAREGTGAGSAENYADARQIEGASADSRMWVESTGGTGGRPHIYANLDNAAGANINEFRTAFAMQRYQEARARYGSRYTEYLRYLGIRPSDQRLSRPEYLGGGSTRLNFSEVLQTNALESAAGSEGAEVGDLYGHGIAGLKSNAYRKFFDEHGFVISLMSVRPKVMYTDRTDRQWYRKTKEDYFQKELQFIGQQEVYNKELHNNHADGDGIFGYQDRYDEYRQHPSKVTNDFRSGDLAAWHMARGLSDDVALNESFINCDPTKRIHQVTTEPALWCMINHHLVARRLVSKKATSKIF